MSRIVHSQTHAAGMRPMWIGAAIVVAVVALWLLVWRDAGAPAEPEAPTAMRPMLQGGATPAAGSSAESFPALRLSLIAIELNTAPPGATLEVEARRARFVQGQEVFPGIRLDRVFSDRVVLVYGQATRTLRVEAPVHSPATAAAADADDPDEIRVRNKGIDAKLLTRDRPLAADAFLREVHVSPGPRGGFVVEEVMPGSVYDKLGLRRGDVIYSLDVAGSKPVDESSMISLMQQTTLEMDVYRNGAALRLRHDLTADSPPDAPAPPR